MPVRQKLLPKGLKQGDLSGYIDIPQPITKVLEEVKKLRESYTLPSYDSPSQGDSFDYNDMVREAIDVLDPERLRFRMDCIIGFNSFIIVCPSCNRPVEPVPVAPIQKGSDCIFFRDPKFHPTWVSCGKCGMQYFLVELVKDRSFRQKFRGEHAVLVDLVK